MSTDDSLQGTGSHRRRECSEYLAALQTPYYPAVGFRLDVRGVLLKLCLEVRFRDLLPLGAAYNGQWRRQFEAREDQDPAAASLLQHAQPSPQNLGSTSEGDTGRRQETREETLERIFGVIQSFQRDSTWDGPSYDLLNRNCNHFSDALAFALTGRHAPAWINRAAWIGLQLPCLVPNVSLLQITFARVVLNSLRQGWVEPPQAQLDESSGTQAESSTEPTYPPQQQPHIPQLKT